MSQLQDRIAGALAGMVLGDAFGVPGELWPRAKVRERFGRITEFLDGPADNIVACYFKAGHYTDDSAQAFVVLNAIEAAALFIVHAKKRLPELLAENAAAGPASSSIDLVSGGAAENVVPASASVTIDFRYQGVESAQVQCDRIKKILSEVRTDPDFPPVSTSLTVTGDWTALSTDMTQPLAQATVAALGESLGHIPETTEMTGWGEGGSMQKFGIPAFYFGPGDGPLAHTPKESVSVSEIKTAVKALFHLVDRLVVHPKL